jgi:bifunctional N-acetylglucosamine-1-phosphate-uridyltransferase/glucosamine-1-phosphate-acetyltransferase GlmU-like protein
MLDHLFDLYRPHVGAFVVVASPDNAAAIAHHARAADQPIRIAMQERPTGMLDAILAAREDVRATGSDRVWITWCDQVAMHPDTVARLAAAEASRPDAALVLPTVRRSDPYIHFERDLEGRISAVRQRREGDEMPPEGESDAGLFAMSMAAFETLDRVAAGVEGRGTRERNFLPVIPLIARTGDVVTFDCLDAAEAVGINTPEELRTIEAYLREKGRP